MVDRRVLDYIKSNISKGYSLQAIYEELILQGMNQNEIRKYIELVEKSLSGKKIGDHEFGKKAVSPEVEKFLKTENIPLKYLSLNPFVRLGGLIIIVLLVVTISLAVLEISTRLKFSDLNLETETKSELVNSLRVEIRKKDSELESIQEKLESTRLELIASSTEKVSSTQDVLNLQSQIEDLENQLDAKNLEISSINDAHNKELAELSRKYNINLESLSEELSKAKKSSGPETDLEGNSSSNETQG